MDKDINLYHPVYPLIKSAFGPLFSCDVARVVGPGGGLLPLFRDLTVSFSNLH